MSLALARERNEPNGEQARESVQAGTGLVPGTFGFDSGRTVESEYLMAARDLIRGLPWGRIPRRILLASAAAIAVVLVSVLGARLIQGWRVERELTAAKAYVQQRDEKNALLSLKKALLLRPAHIEARRALASLLEELTSAEAIGHRRKLVELQPQLLEPKLELVETALRFGDASEASRTLKTITGPQRKMPRVMELQAQVYLAQGRPDLALGTLWRTR